MFFEFIAFTLGCSLNTWSLCFNAEKISHLFNHPKYSLLFLSKKYASPANKTHKTLSSERE